MTSTSDLERARALLAEADAVLVLTGAGISADSGLPTFRGEEGLWKRYRPEELATPEAFARDPRLVWEWYGWRRSRVLEARPNPAHRALARWAGRRHGVTLVTQNVDGLHARAADEVEVPEPDLIELHGSLLRVRCTACPERYGQRQPVDATSVKTLPRCRGCGELLRPDVVWFGEPLPPEALGRALDRARRAEACLVVGTSARVYPAAGVAAAAVSTGARLVEVNPDPTPLTPHATVSLRARAAEAVPRVLNGGESLSHPPQEGGREG